jgi:hypothetical protein
LQLNRHGESLARDHDQALRFVVVGGAVQIAVYLD